MKKIGMPKMYKKNEFWWGGVIYSQKKRKLYTVYIVTNKVIIVNLRNIKIHIMKKQECQKFKNECENLFVSKRRLGIRTKRKLPCVPKKGPIFRRLLKKKTKLPQTKMSVKKNCIRKKEKNSCKMDRSFFSETLLYQKMYPTKSGG